MTAISHFKLRSDSMRPPQTAGHFADDPQSAVDALFHVNVPEDRHDWIDLATSAKRAGVSFDDFHAWSKGGPSYAGEQDCRTNWKAMTPSGPIGPGTLFGAAYAAGWKPKTGMNQIAYRPRDARAVAPKQIPISENMDAAEVWAQCKPATSDHAYVEKKAGVVEGTRLYPMDGPGLHIQGQSMAGYLAVPCYSAGRLQTIQFIPPQGKKLNLAGASFNDGYFAVGTITDARNVYIVEGIGQAWACQKASGDAAVVTFGAGRTSTVAMAIKRDFPDANLVLVPDRGKETDAARIATELGCRWIEMPPDKSSNYDANDFAKEHGVEALACLMARFKIPPMRYRMLSANDLRAAEPLKWRVNGVLPAVGLAALYGPSGSGKSFLVLDLATVIAGGAVEWYGKRVTPCPVTYCVLEGEAGMGKRVDAWCRHHDKPAPDKLKFVAQPVNLIGGDDVIDLAKSIIAAGGTDGLVILDTLNRAAPGADENSSKDMGSIIAAAKQLQLLVGGLVLLVHHTGKNQDLGMRGHSSLFAALDAAIGVNSKIDGRHWTVAKSKDDATGAEYGFRLEPVVVGIDEDGDEITSCVTLPIAVPLGLRKSKSLSDNQETALSVLTTLCGGGERVLIEDAIKAVAADIDTGPKYKRIRAKESLESLVKKSLIETDDVFFWINPL